MLFDARGMPGLACCRIILNRSDGLFISVEVRCAFASEKAWKIKQIRAETVRTSTSAHNGRVLGMATVNPR